MKFFINLYEDSLLMILFQDVCTLDGTRTDLQVLHAEDRVIDGAHLTLFPALIDPHVHFRTPGAEHKENWITGAKAALAGGVTTVFDMPNNLPFCSTAQRLAEKKKQIDAQIEFCKIPLRYHLFFGAEEQNLMEIPKVKQQIIGVKIFADSRMQNKAAIDNAFRIAAENDVLLAVHAEDGRMIEENHKFYAPKDDFSLHSHIRNPAVAASSIAYIITLAKKYNAKVYVAHVSSQKELELIRVAKKDGVRIYAEAAPHHLFLDESYYSALGKKALVNPPLRSPQDRKALWEAIHDGTIDTVGTDHAPHTLEEKNSPYCESPSGYPSIELYFPLLLNAYREKKLSLKQIVSLTSQRAREIFSLNTYDDYVLVDLNKTQTVTDEMLHTKVQWSPYRGWRLTGWPCYTILDGKIYIVV